MKQKTDRLLMKFKANLSQEELTHLLEERIACFPSFAPVELTIGTHGPYDFVNDMKTAVIEVRLLDLN